MALSSQVVRMRPLASLGSCPRDAQPFRQKYFTNVHPDCPAPQFVALAPCHTICRYREEFASVLFATSLPTTAGGDQIVPQPLAYPSLAPFVGRAPGLRPWWQFSASASPVLHIPFELHVLFQVQHHQYQAGEILTVLILLATLLLA